MPQRELVLHIGLGKCGTSSLQSFLALNAHFLYDLGYYYPELESLDDARAATITSGNGALLARSLLDEEHFFFAALEKDWMTLLEENIRCHVDKSVILSSEFFSILRRDRTKELVKFLNRLDLRVRIVCYIRRQDEMALSNYIQGLIAGHSSVEGSFEEEVVRVSKRFCYSTLLAPWIRLGRKNKLILRIFDKYQLVDGDVISDFLYVLGLNEQGHSFVRPRALNESLNAVSAYLVYLLRKEKIEDAAVHRLISMLKTIDWRASDGNAVLLGDDSRRKILSSFASDNQRVARKLRGKSNGILFESLEETVEETTAGIIPDLAAALPLIISCIR